MMISSINSSELYVLYTEDQVLLKNIKLKLWMLY